MTYFRSRKNQLGWEISPSWTRKWILLRYLSYKNVPSDPGKIGRSVKDMLESFSTDFLFSWNFYCINGKFSKSIEIFLLHPENLEIVWCPQIAHSKNHCSPQNSKFLKFQSDLVASKYDHKICIEDSKFISSGFRVDRWRFKKILATPDYVTPLRSYRGLIKCITLSGTPCIASSEFDVERKNEDFL